MIDSLDIQIISRLQEDGRLSYSQVAESVLPRPVSAATVGRRMKRLLQDGYMRVTAVQEKRALGYLCVIFGLNVQPNRIDSVVCDLATIPEVECVMFTSGAYDVFGWAMVASTDDLSELLRCQVGQIVGVLTVNTFLEIENTRSDHGIRLAVE